MYEFDGQGRIVRETSLDGKTRIDDTTTKTDTSWRYDPANNKWRYYVKDETGNTRYLRSEARGIDYNGQIYYYIFDENGFMKTGLTEFNGDTYYLQEAGPLKGTVYVGTTTLLGKEMTFDGQGKLVKTNEKKNMKVMSVAEAKVNAYPVGENGDPKEAKATVAASPSNKFTAKVMKQ